MKFYKAILHTGGKTPDQIRKHDSQDYTNEEAAQIIAYMDAWDGLEVFLVDSYDSEGYTFIGNTEAVDDKVKEAIWLMEQDPLFGCYIDAREEFDEVWAAGEYEPFGCIGFEREDVEIIEEKIQEEPKKITSIPFYFEISKGANLAHDEEGNPVECYTEVKINLKEGVYESQVAAVQKDNEPKVSKMLSEKMKVDIIHIRSLTHEEYIQEVGENEGN